MRDGSTAVGFTKANCQNKKSPANMCPRGRVGGCYICLAAGQRRAAGGGVHGGSRPQQPADPSSQPTPAASRPQQPADPSSQQRASREPAESQQRASREPAESQQRASREPAERASREPAESQRPCAHTAADSGRTSGEPVAVRAHSCRTSGRARTHQGVRHNARVRTQQRGGQRKKCPLCAGKTQSPYRAPYGICPLGQ